MRSTFSAIGQPNRSVVPYSNLLITHLRFFFEERNLHLFQKRRLQMIIRLKRALGIWLFGLSLMTLGVAESRTLDGDKQGGATVAGIGGAAGNSAGRT